MINAERKVKVIAAINASCGFLPPIPIFPRVNFNEFMLTGPPDGTIGADQMN